VPLQLFATWGISMRAGLYARMTRPWRIGDAL
jgi:hypothetical protein